METFELLNELSKKPKDEIEYCIKVLMMAEKLDFLTINKAYTEYLEYLKEDRLNQLVEAETCAFLGLVYFKKDKKKDNKVIQRILYMLNQSRRLMADKINEQYNYDEELGKSQSWYENNKRR